ncbi:MAG: lipid-A-disaccharide synthase [Ignavibacteria bacterium]|nr:lipid-A-disaccharide synthase [Ignavibacteria bacterium]
MVDRVMMIAGEASGDLHGSGVVRELKRRVPSIDVFGMGGDKMEAEGMELIYHMSSLCLMGFVEVLKNIPMIRSVEQKLERLLEQRKPAVVVLIDYPGFNLRFARKAKEHGVKVLYYISPQVWAWNKGRVKKMKRVVDKMDVVFPFEVDIYTQENIDVEFVGHPLAETLRSSCSRESFFQKHKFNVSNKLLGLFPGSRPQEIKDILPTLVAAASKLQRIHSVQVAIGVAPNLSLDLYNRFTRGDCSITLIENGTYDLMEHSDAIIVASGTATLESGWFGTPMVVVYRTSPVTYFIGRLLVNVPHIGLVNIVARKPVVPEFVQHEMNPENLVNSVSRILQDEAYAQAMRTELSIVKKKLGAPGASGRVADGIIALGQAA